MATIEETYAILEKGTGRDLGLLVLRSTMGGRGIIGTEIQVLPIDPRGLQAGEYCIQFLNHAMTRDRMAQAI